MNIEQLTVAIKMDTVLMFIRNCYEITISINRHSWLIKARMGYWSPVEPNILLSRMGQPIIYFKTN